MSTSEPDIKHSNGFGHIEPEEIQIAVPWGHISGQWWGPKDTQPILALHGWQDNSGSFDKLAPMIINNGTSLLSIDQPGHGASSHLHDGAFYYVFWEGVIVLRRIAKHYKWDKIKLLGHSLGGAISFLYAAAYPKEVDFFISLDIVSPTVKNVIKSVENTGPAIEKFLSYEKLTLDNVPCYEYNEMIDLVLEAYRGEITRESAETLMKRGMQPAPLPGRHYFSRDPRLKVSMLGVLSQDLTNAYAEKIKCPYLNIRAKSGLQYDYPNHYQEVLDIIKASTSKFEYHEVEGTHHVHLNDPDKVAPIINNFLQSLKN